MATDQMSADFVQFREVLETRTEVFMWKVRVYTGGVRVKQFRIRFGIASFITQMVTLTATPAIKKADSMSALLKIEKSSATTGKFNYNECNIGTCSILRCCIQLYKLLTL